MACTLIIVRFDVDEYVSSRKVEGLPTHSGRFFVRRFELVCQWRLGELLLRLSLREASPRLFDEAVVLRDCFAIDLTSGSLSGLVVLATGLDAGVIESKSSA